MFKQRKISGGVQRILMGTCVRLPVTRGGHGRAGGAESRPCPLSTAPRERGSCPNSANPFWKIPPKLPAGPRRAASRAGSRLLPERRDTGLAGAGPARSTPPRPPRAPVLPQPGASAPSRPSQRAASPLRAPLNGHGASQRPRPSPRRARPRAPPGLTGGAPLSSGSRVTAARWERLPGAP